MKLHIKNMVCQRCILAVEQALNELNVDYYLVELGCIDFGKHEINPLAHEYHALGATLTSLGFEILNSKQSQIIEAIKRICIREITQPTSPKIPLSKQISDHLHTDYSHLSQMFSSVEGITIEQYFIEQRIEKVKELLIYDEMTLSEIAYDLGFSSVAHLSGQFKKISGMTPSYFRSLKDNASRTPIDKRHLHLPDKAH